MIRLAAGVLTLLLASLDLTAAAGPPAATAEPPPEALVAAIPFSNDAPPTRIMIDLAPEGHSPFVMLLDTGAATSFLTPRMARAMGVHVRPTKNSPYRRATRLGRDLQFWVDVRSSDTASQTGWEYGLLGADFLDDYVVEIDYPGRFVRFYDPRKFRVPDQASQPDEQVLRFHRNGTRILTELEVEGTPLRVMLDTGSPSVLLAGPAAHDAGIEWKSLPVLPGAGGTMGPIGTVTYHAHRVRFAGFEFADQPIAIAPHGAYNQGGPTDSVIGYDVLHGFVLRIDYPRQRLWVRRAPVHEITYCGRLQAAPTHAEPTPGG